MNLSNEQLEEFLKQINRDEFAAQLNTNFRVNNETDVQLVEVSAVKKYPRQESFSMLFLFPKIFPAVQGNYLFEHPQLGAHEIFITPIEDATDGYVFEAVFNRILPKI